MTFMVTASEIPQRRLNVADLNNPFSSTFMGDENYIRTLEDYSKPSHEGYRNTIHLLVGNNEVPLRYDAIRTVKLCNDILMFKQHHEESLSEAWTHFKDLLLKVPHHGIDLWLQVQIFYDHVNPVTRRTIDQSTGGRLRDRNAKESWALLEDLALYDNETQLAPTQPTQVNKVTTSCGICNGPHDTQYCMKDPEQALWNTHPHVPMKREFQPSDSIPKRSFKNRPQSFNNQSNLEGLVSNFMTSEDARLSNFEADFEQQQSEMTHKIDTVLKA
nr:hypothetical protein [Tanacetum cinerariifolium]